MAFSKRAEPGLIGKRPEDAYGFIDGRESRRSAQELPDLTRPSLRSVVVSGMTCCRFTTIFCVLGILLV